MIFHHAPPFSATLSFFSFSFNLHIRYDDRPRCRRRILSKSRRRFLSFLTSHLSQNITFSFSLLFPFPMTLSLNLYHIRPFFPCFFTVLLVIPAYIRKGGFLLIGVVTHAKGNGFCVGVSACYRILIRSCLSPAPFSFTFFLHPVADETDKPSHVSKVLLPHFYYNWVKTKNSLNFSSRILRIY